VQLDHARTLRFDERSGNLYPTEQGRVASHFYVGHKSMEEYNQHLKRHMNEADVFHMVAHSAEFENIIVRDEEVPELQTMARKLCPVQVEPLHHPIAHPPSSFRRHSRLPGFMSRAGELRAWNDRGGHPAVRTVV